MKKLGFGFMRLPLTDEKNLESINQEVANEMVDLFMEKGFTYFDTAYPYHNGKSEAALKKALVERYPRESFVLADKMPVWKVTCYEDYRKYFDEQLQRCGVSYFDYYLLHALGEKSYADVLKNNGFEFMQKIKAEGKVKHIGFSFHDKPEVLERILSEHPEMEFVQLQINYIDWESEYVESRGCYETAQKYHMPVVVMEPVRGGFLADVPGEADTRFREYRPDMSAASWAIRFAASQENVFMVLSGMSNLEQIADNVSYMRDFIPLNEEEKKIIGEAAEIICNNVAIPCTVCRYCIEACPQNIPIPKYFSLYNNQKQFGLSSAHRKGYMETAGDHGKASDCKSCKQCERHCPQHIEIAEQMKEVAKVFDTE